MKLKWMSLILSIVLAGCSKGVQMPEILNPSTDAKLYSMAGREHQVQFQALYRSNYRNINDVPPQSLSYEIKKTTQFLFGPLTQRNIGGAQKGEKIEVQMDQAFIKDNRVMIPYLYKATWIIHQNILKIKDFRFPVPYSTEILRTPDWQNCTDTSDEEHRTWGFFWYFWDPERLGCDHQDQVHYQEVQIQIGAETEQTKNSFPEYKNMIRMENGTPTLAMTFAFGYVKDISYPNPFRDQDPGMREFQKFYQKSKSQLLSLGLKENPIRQSDITQGSTVIGAQFTGLKNGVQLRVSILAAAGVDQMDIFANSYAQKHEGFFGWFGHSRVGSGFDADILKYKLLLSPEQFSISPEYQMVYWAGCNSYSYYTLPFFELKSQLNPQKDPNGTLKLDLISNALPSLFSFNAQNAQVLLQALLNWDRPTSYQSLIDQIELYASTWNYDVIVNVLGDEDNI